ncbi:MAG: formate dehydrogenase accessory sulfurtransferase FdhD [Bacteroidetes bacterium]|nr:formate dehydrogenase accessory sulfurtransferase FdhD [Bacteroidota bacterium]
MNASIQLPVLKVKDDLQISSVDTIPVEEPLEIRLAYYDGGVYTSRNLAVTMRTPGNDIELASGFIFTEGIISHFNEIEKSEYVFAACSENKQNVIQITLDKTAVPNLSNTERNFYTTSSCGVCGKASINAIRTANIFSGKSGDKNTVNSNFFLQLPNRLIDQQKIFADTGGLHASALFNQDGRMLFVREDVGRHNALDKLIGACLIDHKIPLNNSVLLLSGRASFELVQKAAMAGITIIAAIGAPSSLAVSLAEEFGITLVGFLRDNRFNIYSADYRIKMSSHENSY